MKKGFTLIGVLIACAIVGILLIIIICEIGAAKEQRIIEDRCNPKWARCTLDCASYGLTTSNELDVCIKKCDVGREACSVLEK